MFFLLDTVPRLDLRRVYAPYEEETRGAPPFDPALMGCLLLYAYCVGLFSSRKIALACERNLAFMAIVGQERPDFRTIAISAHSIWRSSRTCLCRWCAAAAAPGEVGQRGTDGTKSRQCVTPQGDEL